MSRLALLVHPRKWRLQLDRVAVRRAMGLVFWYELFLKGLWFRALFL